MLDPNRPHNALPLLPPAADIETRPILKQCARAREALAGLKMAGLIIPDQSVLINVIPLLEAKASSAIENIVTTNDALFRDAGLNEADGNPAAKEAVRYRTALYQGFKSMEHRPLTTRTAVEVCQTIKGVELDVRATPGTTLRNGFTGDVIYTPPEGQDHLRNLLGNWERFLNDPSDIDPVVRMAVQHYQFEAIHPFIDGNGRTGRVLNILSLIQAGLLDMPTLHLSRQILATRSEYYRLLAAVTSQGDWEPWILYMVTAVETTARWTNAKAGAIRSLMDATAQRTRELSPKIPAHELMSLIFGQPYCRIEDVVSRGIARRQTASTYLKELAALGILIEEKKGRELIFVHRKYLDLLGSDGHAFEPYPPA